MRKTSEPAFVSRMRAEIQKTTGQDFDPDDPVYPLLCCVQVMSRDIARELRAEDEKILKRIGRDAAKSFGEQVAGMARLRDEEAEKFETMFKAMKNRVEGVEREVYQRSTEKFKLGVFCGSLMALGCVSGFMLARFLF